MNSNIQNIKMIVNADDFGYFDQVSMGIIDAAAQGVVTATGVLANGPVLEKWIDSLKMLPTVSIGVHLNATLGRPLSNQMRDALGPGTDQFMPKGALVSSLIQGRLSKSTLLQEWREQILRCSKAGLNISFINSHEHVHMLPLLYSSVRQLAMEFGIKHVRAPLGEWKPTLRFDRLFRSTALSGCRLLVAHHPEIEPDLIGLSVSGQLDIEYCRWRFSRMRANRVYELMCHPGYIDKVARKDAKLCAYHDWEGEMRTLLSSEFIELIQDQGISLVSFSELEKDDFLRSNVATHKVFRPEG